MVSWGAEINALIIGVLGVIGGVLVRLLLGYRKLKHEASERAKQLIARQESERADREEAQAKMIAAWQKDLYDEVHLWRNKFQVLENKLGVVRAEKDTLSERLNNVQAELRHEQDTMRQYREELRRKDDRIAELESNAEQLQRQIGDLRRRLAKYEEIAGVGTQED